jgi:hypothetical protein
MATDNEIAEAYEKVISERVENQVVLAVKVNKEDRPRKPEPSGTVSVSNPDSLWCKCAGELEENNTCFSPMVVHGFSKTVRIMSSAPKTS